MIRDLAIAVAVFAVVTAVAELLGAANLGTAATFGQIAFLGTILALILLRDREPRP
jgi:hypothetical protein